MQTDSKSIVKDVGRVDVSDCGDDCVSLDRYQEAPSRTITINGCRWDHVSEDAGGRWVYRKAT